MTLLLDDASHKLQLASGAGTTAPPTLAADGADVSSWKQGPYNPRRAAIRFVAAGAMNLTAISIWAFFDGAWSKIATPANITFAVGDLSFTAFVDFPIGSRIAAAFTVSASTVTVHGFPLESIVC